MSQQNLIYLDYAATTPVDPEVVEVMKPYWRDKFGNAESIHKHGQEALKAIDNAREIIKDILGASALREIIFTGSATEANNIAIQGVLSRLAFRDGKKTHAITSSMDHASILEPCRYMEARGLADITYITPDKDGIISSEKIKEALRPDTALVSIGYANNEIGTIQDIPGLSRIIKEFRGAKKIPYIHTDAVQAVQFLNMNVEDLGVDLMTLSGHKIYGPKGIGALYIRDEVALEPLMYGGNQEYTIRPGTQNTALIAGFAHAMRLIESQKKTKENRNIQELRDYLSERIQAAAPYAEINGSKNMRLPNNINMCLPGQDGASLIIGLSESGICVSSGSACSARAQEPSYVIQAIGKTKEEARSSMRITLGKQSSKRDADMFIDAFSSLLHNRK